MNSFMNLVDRLEAYSAASVWFLELIVVVILVRAIFLLHTLEFDHIRGWASLFLKTEKEVKIIEEEKKKHVVGTLIMLYLDLTNIP